MMWSAVCSEAPHSQFGEGAAPHLYMDEWNRLTPVRRRFSFTQDVLGKPFFVVKKDTFSAKCGSAQGLPING